MDLKSIIKWIFGSREEVASKSQMKEYQRLLVERLKEDLEWLRTSKMEKEMLNILLHQNIGPSSAIFEKAMSEKSIKIEEATAKWLSMKDC